MNKTKLVKNNKSNILNRYTNRSSVFSKFADLSSEDEDCKCDEQLENVSDLTNKLNSELNFDTSKSIRNKIKKKKEIKNNIFAIKESKSIKDATPIKKQAKSGEDQPVDLSANVKKDLVKMFDEPKPKREKKVRKVTKVLKNNDLYAKNITKYVKDGEFEIISII